MVMTSSAWIGAALLLAGVWAVVIGLLFLRSAASAAAALPWSLNAGRMRRHTVATERFDTERRRLGWMYLASGILFLAIGLRPLLLYFR